MKWGVRGWHRAVIAAAVIFFARPAHATIQYSVSVAQPDRHVFGVTVRVPAVRDQLTVQMPAWNALYQIRDFASHVMEVSAHDDSGQPLSLQKLDKQTWRVAANGSVTITYPIYWDDAGPFNSQLNPDHAFINLAMILLYVPDRRAEDTIVKFDDVPSSWRVAVELQPASATTSSAKNAFIAPSYDALVDAPVEIGEFEEFHFEAGGRLIRVVVHGDFGDRAKLSDALKRIVDYQVSLMGGAPFPEYMFLFHVGPNFGGGGMEHSNCTSIAAAVPSQLPTYSAHEFFHTWNVKRIRPQALEPVDYSREMWTRSLWFAEGVTNTYETYTLVRTGLWSAQQFYANLAGNVNDLESRPAHLWQSAEQSSLDAWYEKYSLYNRPEESVSYYNKGQLLGVMLDILIRDRTENRASLDDVLRTLNVEYAQRGRFYNESEDVRAVAESVIRKKSPASDANLEDFFKRYVAGIDEIPFANFLGRAGLAIRDTGQRRAAFGFALTRESGGLLTVGAVDMESPADHAGLKTGDIVLSLNGEALARAPERWLRDHQPDEHIVARVRRAGKEMEISFALGRQSDAIYQITEMSDANDRQRRIRNGLLRGTTDSP